MTLSLSRARSGKAARESRGRKGVDKIKREKRRKGKRAGKEEDRFGGELEERRE